MSKLIDAEVLIEKLQDEGADVTADYGPEYGAEFGYSLKKNKGGNQWSPSYWQ